MGEFRLVNHNHLRFVWQFVVIGLVSCCPRSSVCQNSIPNDTQDLLVVYPGGTIKVRLRLNINGQPFRTRWRLHFSELWRELDQNQDGKLSSDEKIGLPWISSTGDLSKTEFFRQAEENFPPLELRALGTPAGASTGLFELLDTNHDGNLSVEELKSAETLLRRRDFDDNGVLTATELQPPFVPGQVFGAEVFASNSAGEFPPLPASKRMRKTVGENQRPTDDARPADVQVWLNLGKTKLPPAINKPANSEIQLRAVGSGYEVDAGDLKINIQPVLGSTQNQMESRTFPLFRDLDVDQNGYLSPSETKALIPEKAFGLLDRNGDGKVTEAEYVSFVLRRKKIADSTCLLAFSDLGQDVFGSLDTDGNGVLTRQELQNARRLVETMGGGKSYVSGRVFPRRLEWKVSQSGLQSRPAMMVAPNENKLANVIYPKDTPAWFLEMDENRDGVVDVNEFLGKGSDFKKIDRNGDGLLSPEEAAFYRDHQLRPTSPPDKSR